MYRLTKTLCALPLMFAPLLALQAGDAEPQEPDFGVAIAYSAKTDLMPCERDGKWGYKLKSGKEIIKPQFEDCRSFSEGTGAVRTTTGWGFVNRNGEFLVNPRFDQVLDFAGGLAALREGIAWGFV